MQPTLLKITESRAEVLGPDGWHETDWVQLPHGNFLSINSEGFAAGFVQGLAAGVLVALIVLGVYAGAVS
jgi:hypothetical protein